jgi:hypothetical protein
MKGTSDFGSLPGADLATAYINALCLLQLYHRQEIAIVRFEYTKLPQEEDLPPNQAQCINCGAMQHNPTDKVYCPAPSEIF